MTHLFAQPQTLEALLEAASEEPIFILNLLSYREEAQAGHGVDGMSGPEAFMAYSERYAELNIDAGGEVVWMGQGGVPVIGPTGWDVSILVRYPTARQYVEAMTSDLYGEIDPMRAAALTDSRMIAFRAMPDVGQVLAQDLAGDTSPATQR